MSKTPTVDSPPGRPQRTRRRPTYLEEITATAGTMSYSCQVAVFASVIYLHYNYYTVYCYYTI